MNISIQISVFVKDTNDRGSLKSNYSLTSVMLVSYN